MGINSLPTMSCGGGVRINPNSLPKPPSPICKYNFGGPLASHTYLANAFGLLTMLFDLHAAVGFVIHIFIAMFAK